MRAEVRYIFRPQRAAVDLMTDPLQYQLICLSHNAIDLLLLFPGGYVPNSFHVR